MCGICCRDAEESFWADKFIRFTLAIGLAINMIPLIDMWSYNLALSFSFEGIGHVMKM